VEDANFVAIEVRAIELGAQFPLGICFVPLSAFATELSDEVELPLSRLGLHDPAVGYL
jgi:hypothetical protein